MSGVLIVPMAAMAETAGLTGRCRKLGITARKTVKSFDQVLKLTGNLEEKYLREPT